ncbi:MAG: NlpC/P60 family protein [Luteolibacter sp.]
MLLRSTRFLLVVSLAALAALVVWPYHDGALRFGLVLATMGVWTSLLWFLRRSHWKWPLLMLPVVMVIPFGLPSGPVDDPELRADYIAAMKHYEGVRYLWGGESGSGIDCSGLPRRAMRDALFRQGWRHGNGAAFREWADQWWHDASAKSLGEGYRGLTRSLGISGTVRTVDVGRLQPGDLAITRDGRHVMVYFGAASWISADPGVGKVVLEKAAGSSNPWFDAPVSMYRWATFPEETPG